LEALFFNTTRFYPPSDFKPVTRRAVGKFAVVIDSRRPDELLGGAAAWPVTVLTEGAQLPPRTSAQEEIDEATGIFSPRGDAANMQVAEFCA
jgi:hypothetical protein